MADPTLTGATITFQTNDDVVNPLTRDQLKTGNMKIAIKPNGNDTWRFNFFLDLRFSDGSHLFARASRLQLTETFTTQGFGIE